MKRSLTHASLFSLLLPALAIAACSATQEERAVTDSVASAYIAGTTWQGWDSLGGGLATDPTIVANGQRYNTRRDVFATGPDGAVYTRWFDAINWNPTDGSWTSLGGGNRLGPPAAIAYGVRIDVFARDEVTHHLMHLAFDGNAWGPRWDDFGGDLAPGKPAVAKTDSRVEVIATFSDGSVHARAANGGSPWVSLGGVALYEPGVASWGGGRLDVLVAGTDHALYHRYSDDSGTTWYPAGGWEKLGGDVAATPAVTTWGVNELDIFTSARDQSIHHIAWNATNWSPWQSVGGAAYRDPEHGVSAPVALTSGAFHIDLFVQGTNRGLFHTSVDGPLGDGNFNYKPWEQMTSCFRTGGAPSVVSRDGKNMDVVATAFDANNNGSVWFTSTELFGGTRTPPACACGNANQTCCVDDTCSAGNQCDVNGARQTCVPAGAVGQECRHSGVACDGSAFCDGSNHCVACGALGQPSCPGGVCQGGNVPNYKGLCEPPCGVGNGSACCPNADPTMAKYPVCANGFICSSWGSSDALDNGRCQPCGGIGQECCTDWRSVYDWDQWCFPDGSWCDNTMTCQAKGPPPPPPGACTTPPRLTATYHYMACNQAGALAWSVDLTNATCGKVTATGTITLYPQGDTVHPAWQGTFTTNIGGVGSVENIAFSPNVPAGTYTIWLSMNNGIGGFLPITVEVSSDCSSARAPSNKALSATVGATVTR